MTLTALIPIFPTADLDRTEAFYHGLGFETYVRYDDYLTTHYQGVELHFQLIRGVFAPRTAYVRVTGVDAWHTRAQQLGSGELLSAPTDQFYGIREFSLRDPDGNVLHLGEYLKQA